MSEQVESGVVSGESEVQTEPDPISTDGRDEQTSQTELDEYIRSQIREEVERRFQSAKDKRWAQLEKQYGQLHELSERAESGVSRTQVSHGRNLEGEIMGRTARLLKRVGLSNDPEVIALLHDQTESFGGRDYLDLMEDLVAITLRREGREEAPAAVIIQPGGGSAPVEDLHGAYEQRKKKLRPGDVNGLMALKKEFREKGLEIF
jgi:hypothetical protein